jgi:thiamine biosynthesis lipoprotein
LRPPGVHIDLGGMVKGRTVDRAGRLLPSPGAVDAGGDAIFLGAGPDGTGWLVDVEDPRDASRSVATLRLSDCAVATSAANRRHWRVGTARVHHIVDPRSQRPAESDLAQATVIAPTAELADVLAKTSFILGARRARAFLERMPGVGGVLVPRAGEVQIVGDPMKGRFVGHTPVRTVQIRRDCWAEVVHA